MKPLSQWYAVTWDDTHVYRDVRRPRMFRRSEHWSDKFAWDDVRQVCFVCEPPGVSDGIAVFVEGRDESYLIPTEAENGAALLDELVTRGKVPAELLITAATSSSGTFCWPS
jgi:hypothetical protein